MRSKDETSMYCIMCDGKYINFSPIPIGEYYKKNQLIGEMWNGAEYESIVFQPRIEDLEFHRTFNLVDLTYRGTIEYRSCCCQPLAESMTVAAFHMGLVATLNELKELLDSDQVLYRQG